MNCADFNNGKVRLPYLSGPEQARFSMFSFKDTSGETLRYFEWLSNVKNYLPIAPDLFTSEAENTSSASTKQASTGARI